MCVFSAARAQDLQDQEDSGQEGSPEPANPSMDPPEDRQQNKVQREAQELAPHKAWSVRTQMALLAEFSGDAGSALRGSDFGPGVAPMNLLTLGWHLLR